MWADARDWLTEAATPSGPAAAFFLVSFVHAWISLAFGRFGTARTTTWVMLIAGGTLLLATVFLGYALPWRGGTGAANASASAILAADMAVAYLGLWRTRRASAVVWRVAAIALICAIAATLTATRSPDSPTPLHLLPEWFAEPAYALLRCIPGKLAGMILAATACLLPASWPWARAARTGPVWWVLWIGLAMVWTGLGAIGSRPPGFYPATAVWGLAAYHVAFFLLPLIKRAARAGTSG